MENEQNHQEDSEVAESHSEQAGEPEPSLQPEPNNNSEEKTATGSEANPIALLCYLGILVVIPLLTESKKEEFVKFHIKQGLALLVFAAIGTFIAVIPILGWIIGFLIGLTSLILAIIGIVNVLQGKKKELPLIGGYGEKFKI